MDSIQTNPEERIRLGVLVPAVNTVVEPDLYTAIQRPYTLHFSRLPVPTDEATIENLERLEDHLEPSVQSLAQADVKSMAFACTSGSFIKGPDWDRHLIKRMEAIFAPSTTTSSAVVAALETLELKNISLVTPYSESINRLMVDYFSSRGFTVKRIQSLGLKHSREIRRVDPETIVECVQSANSKASDGIVISCTDFPAMAVIESLEKKMHKPVITSNQATLWRLMALSGTYIPISGYGYLMSKARLIK